MHNHNPLSGLSDDIKRVLARRCDVPSRRRTPISRFSAKDSEFPSCKQHGHSPGIENFRRCELDMGAGCHENGEPPDPSHRLRGSSRQPDPISRCLRRHVRRPAAQGRLSLLVAIDRVTKFAFLELHEKATRRFTGDILRALMVRDTVRGGRQVRPQFRLPEAAPDNGHPIRPEAGLSYDRACTGRDGPDPGG